MEWTIERMRRSKYGRWRLLWRGQRTRLDAPTESLAQRVADVLNGGF